MRSAADDASGPEPSQAGAVQTDDPQRSRYLDFRERALFEKRHGDETCANRPQTRLREGSLYSHREITHAIAPGGIIEAIAARRAKEHRIEGAAVKHFGRQLALGTMQL